MGQCLIHRTGVSFKAFINVTATPNSVVSVTLGGETQTLTAAANGLAAFTVKKKGTYSVTSNATGTQTVDVSVTTNKQTYTANIVGRFTLTISTQKINNKQATNVSVSRKSSTYAKAATGALNSGAYIYYGDVLTVSASVTSTTIYNAATLKVNSTNHTSGNDYTVTGNVTAAATTTVKSYKLTISNQTINSKTSTSITVNRTESTNQGAGTGAITNGATIYYGDKLTISCAAANTTIYNTPTLKVNNTAFTSGNSHTVVAAVTAAATTSVKSYTLTITNATINSKTGATVTVTRNSSTNAGAATGTVTAGANKIYYGDVLKITVANSNSTIYNGPTLKVNNTAFTSGNTHTVTGAVTAVASTSVKSYTLTITNATINSKSAATITVNRNSSTNAGAATGTVSAGANKIYYGDVLKITVANANSTVYNGPTLKVNNTAFTSGNTHTVTAAVTAVASSSVKQVTLTVQAGANSTIKLERTASTYAGAANNTNLITKTNANGTVNVYYGDTIKWTFSASTNYSISTHTIGGTARNSGYSWSATGNVTAITTASVVLYEFRALWVPARYTVSGPWTFKYPATMSTFAQVAADSTYYWSTNTITYNNKTYYGQLRVNSNSRVDVFYRTSKTASGGASIGDLLTATGDFMTGTQKLENRKQWSNKSPSGTSY